MKKLFALASAAFIFSAASAQTDRTATSPATAPGQSMQRHHGKHEKDEMMKQLNLTKDQRAQLKAQHKEMKAKREDLKKQDNITVKEMRERQKALKDEQQSKMNSVLNADQRTKMAEIKKQKMAEKGNRKMRKDKVK